ncbi:hypothetical protein DFH06DRAFT_1139219 [Mycena polygramma]|nr:hypothetical protein DFH06DRAFT_1139219 [Mycena polygramma]
MDRADGIPTAPVLSPVPLPLTCTAIPQRLLEAPPTLSLHTAPPAASPFTSIPLDIVMRGRNTLPSPPTASPFTSIPLDMVMRSRSAFPALPATSPFTTKPLAATRGRNTKADRGQRRARYFLMHPPNEPPKCDTRAMVRFGTDAQTGHHVLRPIHTRRGKGKRPDTPGPPFRLVTERPVLLEDADRRGEDASMSSASTRSESMPPALPRSSGSQQESSLPHAEERSHFPTICAPLPQGWMASNSRLEKLQSSARRCAVSTNVAQDAQGIPGFVFSVCKSLADVAKAQRTAEETTGEDDNEQNSDGEHQMDLDDPVVEGEHAEEGEGKQQDPGDRRLPTLTSGSAVAIDPPRQGSNGPEAVRERTFSFSSLSSLSSISLTSPFVHVASNVSSPVQTGDAGLNHSDEQFASPFSRVSTPYLQDCRSTLPSPQTQPLLLDHSDADSLPSLQEVSTDDESSQEIGSECVSEKSLPILVDDDGRKLLPPSDESTPISREELDVQIERIARPPSTPANHSWPITTEWTRNHAAFVTNVRNVQNSDALALLRQADTLLERSPEILDTASMQANKFVDVDLINVLAGANTSDEGCANFAQRVQHIRDTVDAHSPGFVDDSHLIHNIASVPVALDGSRHRLLSSRTLTQPLSYRYAIYILARHYSDWLDVYTRLRKLVRAYHRYLEDLFKQRGWTLDEELLHRPAPVPPPYLTPHEYSRFLLFQYTFELHGYADVARVMGDFLRYRFQEPEIVSHLLHAGLFDPHDIHLNSARGEAFITRRTAPPSYRNQISLHQYASEGSSAGN